MRRSQIILSFPINIPIAARSVMSRPDTSLYAPASHITDFLVKRISVHVIMALRRMYRAYWFPKFREPRSVHAVLTSRRQWRSVVACVAHRPAFASMFVAAEHAEQDAGETDKHDDEEDAKDARGDDSFGTDAALQGVGDFDDSAGNVVAGHVSWTGEEGIGC